MNHSSSAEILAAALEVLDQGELLLGTLEDEDYTRRLPVAYQASIGGHYRHCLDHFRSWLSALDTDLLDYDLRERDPLIESDRFAALNATRELRDQLVSCDAVTLSRQTTVRCKASYACSQAQAAASSLGRELIYVVAHAVHHYALIGVMAALQNVPLPTGFGVAPSTVKHQEEERRGR